MRPPPPAPESELEFPPIALTTPLPLKVFALNQTDPPAPPPPQYLAAKPDAPSAEIIPLFVSIFVIEILIAPPPDAPAAAIPEVHKLALFPPPPPPEP